MRFKMPWPATEIVFLDKSEPGADGHGAPASLRLSAPPVNHRRIKIGSTAEAAWGRCPYLRRLMARCMAAPMSAGLWATSMPAASRAAIFSAAVPLPPAMIAPAWPIRLPFGAVRPAMNAATGLVTCSATYAAASSSAVPPISPIIRIASVCRIGLVHLQEIDERRADDRVAAEADARRLAEAEVRELPDRFVRERAAAAHHADRALLVDVAGHDADLALLGRDHAGAVRADEVDVAVA